MAWAPDYVTVQELAAYARITDSDDDLQLGFAVSAASRAIDHHTHRQFGLVAAPEPRSYTARWDRRRCRWVVHVDDFQTVLGLEVTIDGDPLTGFVAQPVNAAAEGLPWKRLVIDENSPVRPTGAEDEVVVTARWGWTTVPDTIKQAALLQGSRIFTRRNAPFGIAGSPESGSEMRLLSRVDADVAVALHPYMKVVMA